MKSLLFALPAITLSTATMAESAGMPPYTLDPGPHAGNWEVTLTGVGQSDDEFDNTNLGVTGSLGYYFTKNLLLSFKQAVQHRDVGDSDLISGRSVFQAAYQFDLARWQPYLGVNLGGLYGAGVEDNGIVGPEGGIKYFVNESTFIYASIAYEVLISECCDDGVIPYALGIGFDF